MSLFDTSGGVPVGLGSPANMDRMVYNRTGGTTAIGDVVMFDTRLSDAASTTMTLGDSASGLSNVIQPLAASGDLETAYFAICLEAAADDKLMRVRCRGVVKANVDATYAALVGDAEFTALTATDTLDTTGTTGQKIIARPMEAHASSTFLTVLFDGIDGFGLATA